MSFPMLTQNPAYHTFAEQGALFGIPYFWNVVSNAPFLGVAMAGAGMLRRESGLDRWERRSYAALLAGCALVTFGSAYFHLAPSDGRLFWDRLPMTVIFMSLLAAVLGDRVHPWADRYGLAPLLVLGVVSVVYWRATGDLSLYALVQGGSIGLIAAMTVLQPSRYTGANRTVWAMMGLYGLAKVLEYFDGAIGLWIPMGGHPLKHLAAAAALAVYVRWVRRRRGVSEESYSMVMVMRRLRGSDSGLNL
ncbi:MAG: ceramidase domain-containing protein [Bryobacterales bacterium]|nr:ceramidase domain-containing protein [Bryobacterales bacterium]